MAGKRKRATNNNSKDFKNKSSRAEYRCINFKQICKPLHCSTFLNWNPENFEICNNFLGKVEGVEHVKVIDTIDNCFVTLDIQLDQLDMYMEKETLQENVDIKFILNKATKDLRVIELIIESQSDTRIISTKIYRNKFNNFLIVFNKISDHEKIKKMKKQFEIIDIV